METRRIQDMLLTINKQNRTKAKNKKERQKEKKKGYEAGFQPETSGST